MTQVKERLSQRRCQRSLGQDMLLDALEVSKYLSETPDWIPTKRDTILVREFKLRNFMAAVDLINKITALAETENHHPDLHLTSYRKLRVEFTTHDIGGLSENDFIMAAKINELTDNHYE